MPQITKKIRKKIRPGTWDRPWRSWSEKPLEARHEAAWRHQVWLLTHKQMSLLMCNPLCFQGDQTSDLEILKPGPKAYFKADFYKLGYYVYSKEETKTCTRGKEEYVKFQSDVQGHKWHVWREYQRMKWRVQTKRNVRYILLHLQTAAFGHTDLSNILRNYANYLFFSPRLCLVFSLLILYFRG